MAIYGDAWRNLQEIVGSETAIFGYLQGILASDTRIWFNLQRIVGSETRILRDMQGIYDDLRHRERGYCVIHQGSWLGDANVV